MPEPRVPRQRAAEKGSDTPGATTPRKKANQPNPPWFKPVMFGLMLLGLVWIIVFYISQGLLPVPAWGSWNIAAGFGIAIAGFLMSTRWR